MIKPKQISKSEDIGFLQNRVSYITQKSFAWIPNGLRGNHGYLGHWFGDCVKKKRFLKLMHRKLRVLLAVKQISMAIKSLAISLKGIEIENKIIMHPPL
jgi:hypothetical protein